MSAWRAWVALWDRREDVAALAAVRICVGLVLAWDYVEILRLGLADPLFTLDGFARTAPALDAHALVIVALGASIAIALGAATRVACIACVLVSAHLAHVSPVADRGIDPILRIVVCVLALSRSHARWSIDALVWRRLGRPLDHEAPAWPRYLLMLQLVWIYFSGGLNKGGDAWGPGGGFTALANVLADPHVARFEPWLPLPLAQVATAVTIAFELTAPIYLVLYAFAERGRRWAHWGRVVWIAIGVGFHLGIAVGMRLGIFPWGMLALYPVLLMPDEIRRTLRLR